MHRLLLTLLAIFRGALVTSADPSRDLIRSAAAAARGGEFAVSDAMLLQAEEASDDPGLIAFNRAGIAFERGDFRGAEVDYLRALEDGAIPAVRKCRALYNRGVCLVKRGEETKLLRTAIACFEQCLDAVPADDPLAADARHNLELTKLLWNQARAKQQTPPPPNETYEDERPMPPQSEVPPTQTEPDPNGPAERTGNPSTQTPIAQQTSKANPDKPPAGQRQTPAAGTMPVVKDTDVLQKLSPEDTNTLLDRADARLRTARRQNEQMRAGPERPNVRDW